MIGVTINLNDPVPVAIATLKHDGITTLLTLDNERLPGLLKDGPANVVYDSSGREIFTDLQPSEVFNAILNLIAR